VRDVDGNQYIDYALAWGPLILGHQHPKIVEALRRETECAHIYGAQHELEFLVAEKLQTLIPCAGNVVFASSGTEAVQLALRLARAFTGRNLVVKFEGHYHGWIDSALVSYHPTAEKAGDPHRPNAVLGSLGQVPNASDNFLVLPWNSTEALLDIFGLRGSEIAAVILEPVLCNSGCLLPNPGYLGAIRDLCDRSGALLIFDEVITGFRISLGGAQEFFKVRPDIATFGKALAGGAPLSAIAARKDVFALTLDGKVVFGGTYNGNPTSLASAQATLAELSRQGGCLLRHANHMGQRLMSGIREAASRYRIPLVISGFGAAFTIHFTDRKDLANYRDTLEDDPERLRKFVLGALAEGLYLLPDGRIYVSAVHQEPDIEETLGAIDHVFSGLAND
jgi:glutamate-1-semialdehyde 2,1-aminomutase